jgi:hypothetical protein
MLVAIQKLKGDIEEAKFTNGDSDENVESWGKPVVEQLEEVDEKITDLNKFIADLVLREKAQQQQEENKLAFHTRQEQLAFERKQFEQKLEFEAKMSEIKKNSITSSPENSTSAVSSAAKLPKLVITKFNGTHQDWSRFWNQFEAEIDKSKAAAITKFSYLKELVESKVRSCIDGLPFSTRDTNVLKQSLRPNMVDPAK